MTIEQARQLKVDQTYIFTLKDGRKIKKRGSWLASTDKAAAEKAAATRWTLSDRERAIIAKLSRNE